MRTKLPLSRNLLSTAALVVSLLSPALARAYDAVSAAAASDPENAAAHTLASVPSRAWMKSSPERADARAAAASDPENAAAYDTVDAPFRAQAASATSKDARSAMVSDPENVASHSEG
jgi:hypothetical protein